MSKRTLLCAHVRPRLWACIKPGKRVGRAPCSSPRAQHAHAHAHAHARARVRPAVQLPTRPTYACTCTCTCRRHGPGWLDAAWCHGGVRQRRRGNAIPAFPAHPAALRLPTCRRGGRHVHPTSLVRPTDSAARAAAGAAVCAAAGTAGVCSTGAEAAQGTGVGRRACMCSCTCVCLCNLRDT